MNDSEIIELFWQRNEAAIVETSKKYGAYCTKISMNILSDPLDAEECVNDTYWRAWNAIPPQKPTVLSAFLGKIARNLAINRYKAKNTEKRRAGEFAMSLEELGECVPSGFDADRAIELAAIGAAISDFLRSEPEQARKIFIRRYFFSDSVAQIAALFGIGEGHVKSSLFRTRNRLKVYFENRGLDHE